MSNSENPNLSPSILSITEDGDTDCILTNRYTDPLFIARRCSIAAADKETGSMTHKAFPEVKVVAQSPELFSACTTSIDFDRGVFSVKWHEQWFDSPLRAAMAAADWCYDRLGEIPPKERMRTFYLRTATGQHKTDDHDC